MSIPCGVEVRAGSRTTADNRFGCRRCQVGPSGVLWPDCVRHPVGVLSESIPARTRGPSSGPMLRLAGESPANPPVRSDFRLPMVGTSWSWVPVLGPPHSHPRSSGQPVRGDLDWRRNRSVPWPAALAPGPAGLGVGCWSGYRWSSSRKSCWAPAPGHPLASSAPLPHGYLVHRWSRHHWRRRRHYSHQQVWLLLGWSPMGAGAGQTMGVRSDTLMVSVRVRPDTVRVRPDTDHTDAVRSDARRAVRVRPDTVRVRPDTVRARPDTVRVRPDTTQTDAVRSDTRRTVRTVGVRSDIQRTTFVRSDGQMASVRVRPDTVRVRPDPTQPDAIPSETMKVVRTVDVRSDTWRTPLVRSDNRMASVRVRPDTHTDAVRSDTWRTSSVRSDDQVAAVRVRPDTVRARPDTAQTDAVRPDTRRAVRTVGVRSDTQQTPFVRSDDQVASVRVHPDTVRVRPDTAQVDAVPSETMKVARTVGVRSDIQQTTWAQSDDQTAPVCVRPDTVRVRPDTAQIDAVRSDTRPAVRTVGVRPDTQQTSLVRSDRASAFVRPDTARSTGARRGAVRTESARPMECSFAAGLTPGVDTRTFDEPGAYYFWRFSETPPESRSPVLSRAVPQSASGLPWGLLRGRRGERTDRFWLFWPWLFYVPSGPLM